MWVAFNKTLHILEKLDRQKVFERKERKKGVEKEVKEVDDDGVNLPDNLLGGQLVQKIEFV